MNGGETFAKEPLHRCYGWIFIMNAGCLAMMENEKFELEKKEMAKHWLNCPEGSCLGSDYGRPNTSDKTILFAKCLKDLPMLHITEIEAMISKL